MTKKAFMLFLIIKDFSNHRSRVQPFFARKEKKTGLKFNLPPPFVRRIFGPDFKASLASWRCNFFLDWDFLEPGAGVASAVAIHCFFCFFPSFAFMQRPHTTHTHTCSSFESQPFPFHQHKQHYWTDPLTFAPAITRLSFWLLGQRCNRIFVCYIFRFRVHKIISSSA